MKLKSNLKSLLLSSWFLAIIPAVAVMILIPPLGSRYKMKIEKESNFPGQVLYYDLNSDTISESIISAKGVPYYYIAVRNKDYRFHDQWNLPDSMKNDISRIFFGNYDHDRFSEIYVFTHNHDSLFLNINEMLDPSGIRRDRIFITRIGYVNGQVVAVLCPAGFWDVDGDRHDELFFSVSSGFRTGPRKIYSIDIAREKISSTGNTSIIPLNPIMTEADNDHLPEIFGIISASGNYPADAPFSDSSSWFMVFNERLEFEFEPVEFPGFANGMDTKAFNGGYILLHWAGGVDTSVLPSCLMIYSSDGRLMKRTFLADLGYSRQPSMFLFPHDVNDRIIIAGTRLTEVNGLLEVVKTIESPFKSEYITYSWDFNHDGNLELALYSEEENRLAVFNEDLQLLANERFKPETRLLVFSDCITGRKDNKVFIKAGEEGYMLEMKKNRYYFFSYLADPAIYLFFLMFMVFVRRMNTLQIVQKEQLKQRLITLQLQGIKSQLDPHFTFNTLNSVASLIYFSERETAYDYLNKFTTLLRIMLNDAERIYRTLSEEIEFVKTYLELEKLRFLDKFDYKINVGQGITLREEVPKLVLHTFAENALKHGLIPKNGGGQLNISVEKDADYLLITIQDNGIGRAMAEGHSSSTGKGLKLTSEFYDILNEINKKPIRHSITDLFDIDGNPAGTRVEVWVPIH